MSQADYDRLQHTSNRLGLAKNYSDLLDAAAEFALQDNATTTCLILFYGRHGAEILANHDLSRIGERMPRTDVPFSPDWETSQTFTDAQATEGIRTAAKIQGIHGLVAIPFHHNHECIGQLVLGWDTPRRFSAQETLFYQFLALMLQPHFINLYQQSQPRDNLVYNHRVVLEELIRIANINFDETDLQTIYQQILELVIKHLNTTSAYITELVPDQDGIEVVAEYFSEHASDTERESDLGTLYQLLGYETLLAQENFLARYEVGRIDDENMRPALRRELVAFGCKAYLEVILSDEGKMMGTIEAWESRYLRDFSESDIECLQLIGSQAANIIRQYKLHAALKGRETLYRMMTENVGDFITQLDIERDFAHMYVSPAITRNLGYSVDEFVGTYPREFIHEDDYDASAEKIRHAVEHPGEEVTLIYRYRHKAGHYLWIETNARASIDPQTGRQAIFATSRDITKRQLAEDAMRASEEEHRVLIESLPDIILTVDTNLKLNYVHYPGVGHLAELEGHSILDVTPEYEHANIQQQLKQVLETGEPITYETFGWNPLANRHIWNYVTAAPIRNRNKDIIAVSIVSRDITAQKEAIAERDALIEELKIAHRVASENARLKSEFLSTMSHELRTPLNAIEGFTSIMLGNLGVDLNDQARFMIERIGSNSKRLLELINDFLDISRIEAGRMQLVMEPYSPYVLAEAWEDVMQQLARNKGLGYQIEIDPKLPDLLFGDQEAINKVVFNLLSNAFKFTHDGHVSLTLQHLGSSWSVAVADTGIGIPYHAHDYIFDEFRQIDSSSKRVYGGAGLGLAIVQKLTRIMGGAVTLESTPGKGSTFTITIPLETGQ